MDENPDIKDQSNAVKNHWEKIYESKPLEELGWFQKSPRASLELMNMLGISRKSRIIDIGGGDSLFVDYLLKSGFENITVLDISAKAIERAKKRLGSQANKVEWIESDILDFPPPAGGYDLWHDRAAFHFIQDEEKVNRYISLCNKALNKDGCVIVATFSDTGPEKCSGLEVNRYSERKLSDKFTQYFKKIKCITEEHFTPFHKLQNYIFCSFCHWTTA